MDNRAKGLQALGNLSSIHPQNRNASIPLPTSYLQHPMSTPTSSRHAPPPLPPRQTGTYPSRYNRMSTMGSYYSPYSRYPSMGYSSPYYNRMSPYGHYGSPYGVPNDSHNSFIQMAEESTRPAFESIESVVEVVSSISMMLESTYHAVHSSYSAILGVVDQFARLKDHLAEILSILALLRGLRWLCLKVLYLLGLRKDNPSVEAAWNTAEKLANSPEIPSEAKGSAWPFLMFIGLVIGAPWLMFRLLSKTVAKKPFDQGVFVDENGRAYLATAAYDFSATQPNELSFHAGEKLYIAPKCTQNKGWMYACNERKETGLIPSNYLLLKPTKHTRNPQGHQAVLQPQPSLSASPTVQDMHALPNSPSVADLTESRVVEDFVPTKDSEIEETANTEINSTDSGNDFVSSDLRQQCIKQSVAPSDGKNVNDGGMM